MENSKSVFRVIAIGNDHCGYEYKVQLLEYLKKYSDLKVIDCGCVSTKRIDFGKYAHSVCELIQKETCDGGILICGNGIGMSIVANKHRGVRCGLVNEVEDVIGTRRGHNANSIAFGAKKHKMEEVKKFVDAFLTTEFKPTEAGRQEIRLKAMKIYND